MTVTSERRSGTSAYGSARTSSSSTSAGVAPPSGWIGSSQASASMASVGESSSSTVTTPGGATRLRDAIWLGHSSTTTGRQVPFLSTVTLRFFHQTSSVAASSRPSAYGGSRSGGPTVPSSR